MIRRTMLSLVAASVLCAAPNGRAQPASNPAAPPPQQAEARVSIRFPGGSIAEYTAAVKKAFPGANIAVAPGVELVRIAPVELTSVNFNEAMFAIPTLSESPVSVDWFSTTALVDGAAAVRHGREQRAELRVWPMSQLLTQVKPEDALSAIQTAVDMVQQGAEIKFHKDTQILLVRGTPDQLDAINQVINRMLENSAALRGEGRGAGEDAVRGLRAEREQLLQRVRDLEAQAWQFQERQSSKR